MLFRKFKFLQSPVECAAADPEFFCRLSPVSAAFIQCTHDQPDLVVMDIYEILDFRVAMSEYSGYSAHR